MATKQINDDFHLSLSIGKSLWDDLMGAALPVKVKEGDFDLGRLIYKSVKQLQVTEKVAALIEDRQPPNSLIRAKDRAADLWQNRRERVYQTIDDIVRVEGQWRVEVDKEGTEFHYADQKLGVDAHAKAVAHGTAYLLKNNLEVPFTIEKRLGASCHLGDIHYDKESRAVVGEIQEPLLDLGDHVIFQLLNKAVAQLLIQQLDRFSPVPILKRDQVEEMISPAGGPLNLKMGVDEVMIDVTEANLTLRVRFGFSQLQLEG